MNILYLCADTGIPIRGDKGAAVHVRALTDALVRAGHTVTIATPRPGPADGPAPNATITEVGGDWGIRGLSEALVSAAARLLEQSPYDFIYERYSLWSDAGARLARESGLPLVLEVNAPLRLEAAQYRQLSDPETAAAIEATQFQAAQAISVVSEPLRQYVISRGAAPERVHVLPNAVDPTHFHPAVRGGAIHHRYNLGDRIIVGFVGRPRPWHDLDTLLEAFAQLHATDSRYHLLLVGRMPDDLPGRLAAKGLSGAATLTGPVPHLDIPQYIAAMDVAVSTHAPEDPATPFYFSPLKLFEYLAVGVPTVAADVGQPGEIMRKVAGGRWQAASANYQLPMTLYPPGNVEALAGRIRYLVENPAEAREVAWRGATYVLQNHTWDGNAQAVISWIPGRGEATGGGSIHDPDYC
ncbi:MAG: glycosyltransferase family 4 protein, partial [Chloroflexota bacterium]